MTKDSESGSSKNALVNQRKLGSGEILEKGILQKTPFLQPVSHALNGSVNPDFDPFEMPITSELDLHTFRPSDLGDLVPDYLEACRAKGILEVRVIHGKGIGNLKRSVEAILTRLEYVERFAPASELYGGLGATIVHLKPLAK